jgi:hypothetical protein
MKGEKTMNKSGVALFIKNAKRSMSKHAPEIITGIGVAGMVTTTVLAVKATPKALRLIEEVKNEEQKDKLTVVETVKVAWKPYIPAAVTGVVSVACLIGASSLSARRHAALMTAYTLSERALTEYKDKVVETIGEKKGQDIRDAIAKDKVENNPVNEQEIIITGNGETLCCDALFGRYFKSDINRLKQIENEFNSQLLADTYLSLNDFYDMVGLKSVKVGDDIGWNINDGLMKLRFSSQLADGTPCLVVDWESPAIYGYEDR